MGWIYSLTSLDREESDSYVVTAVATDAHDASLFSSVDVRITVDDVNDNAPTFVYPSVGNSTVSISAAVPLHHLVAKLFAVDADTGQNAQLTYAIVGGNKGQHFYVHESSGFLTVAKTFNKIDYKEYRLEVKVQDDGDPSLFSISDFEVVVDSSIAYATADSSPPGGGMMSRGKLVIITVLAVLSAILCVILLAAILFLRRVEKRRKMKQKQKSRMAGLAKLTVNSGGTAAGGVTGGGGGHAADGKTSMTSRQEATNLWKTPSKAQLESVGFCYV